MEKSRLYKLLNGRWQPSDKRQKCLNHTVKCRQPPKSIHTFKPEKPYPPSYRFRDGSYLHEFNIRPHDSTYNKDLITLEVDINKFLASIDELEGKNVTPGSDQHDCLLLTYCTLIPILTELIDLNRKLISFERLYVVRQHMENVIIGLIRCKYKLVQIEAFNITYTINTIIPLKVPLNKTQIVLPKFESSLRGKEIKEFITHFRELLNMVESKTNVNINEGSTTTKVESKNVDNNEGSTTTKVESKNVDNNEGSTTTKVESKNVDNNEGSTTTNVEHKKEPSDTKQSHAETKNQMGLATADFVKTGLKYGNCLRHDYKKAFPELKKREFEAFEEIFDEKTLKLMEKCFFTEVICCMKIYSRKITLDLVDDDDYELVREYYIMLAHDSQALILHESLDRIAAHWFGFVSRQNLKHSKKTLLLLLSCPMTCPSLEETEEILEDMQKAQEAYLKLYKDMYALVTDFMQDHKTYEYAQGVLIQVLNEWRKNKNGRTELPIFVKKAYKRTVRTGMFTWVVLGYAKYRDLMDLLPYELRTISYDPMTSSAGKKEYGKLRAEIHEEIKNILTGKDRLNQLRALISTDEENSSQKENDDHNGREIMKNEDIQYYFDNLENKSLTIAGEIREQKEVMRNIGIEDKSLTEKSIFETSPALSNVIDDMFIDTFVEVVLEPLQGLEPIDEDDTIDDEDDTIDDKDDTSDDEDDTTNDEKEKEKTDENEKAFNMPIKDILKGLIKNEIITQYPTTSFEDYLGTLSLNNERILLLDPRERKQKFIEPMYTAQWLIQAIKEFCVLPFFTERTHKTVPLTRSLLLAGTPGCGKNMLINAVCSHIGAVKFDLSAETIMKSEFFKNNDMETLEIYVIKAAKYLEPSLLYVNNVHTTFLASDLLEPSTYNSTTNHESDDDDDNIFEELAVERENNATSSIDELNSTQVPSLPRQTTTPDTSFLRNMLANIQSKITNDDMILMMGSSNKPQVSDISLLEEVFDKILLVPRVDYRTVCQYLTDNILSRNRVEATFKVQELATLCNGLPIPRMRPLIDHVEKRKQPILETIIDRLCCNGHAKTCKCGELKVKLTINEFTDLLIPMRDDIVSDEQEQLMFEWYENSKSHQQRSRVIKKWRENIQKRNADKISKEEN